MKKKLTKNWGLKLASLMLAFILWFLVVQIDDPMGDQRFNNIPVKLVNTELLENENKVYEVLDNTDTVSVKVSAPRSIREQLRSSDIVAEADISKLTDINTVAITYSVNYEVDKIEGDHAVVRLSVEDKSSKWVKLKSNIVGDVADGYMIASASPDQTLIEVTGPESAVEKISYAGVDIEVAGATSSFSANMEINLYDEVGNLLEFSSIKKNVNYVHMSVEVLAVKEVPIELNVMGTPADGFIATGVLESDPATAKVAGSVSALSNFNKISIPEDRLNITGANSNVTDTINIKEYLPENIRLADSGFNGRITATVYIEPEVEKTLEIPAQNIAIINLTEDLQAELSESETDYKLKVSGLDAFISPLEESTVRGIVDIAAWMEEEEKKELVPGTYAVPVTFNLPEEVMIDEAVYARVVITAREDL